MMSLFANALAVISLASGSASRLKPADFKVVADAAEVKIDPAKSYVLVRAELPGPMAFVRLADPAEIQDYKARRAAAFGKAHVKWVKSHTSWVKLMQAWPRMSYQERPAQKPREPIEPTETNFDFPTIEQENLFSVGPFNRFAKGDGWSTYLEMLPSGRYAFYGAVDTLSGAGQSCLCMGSVAFDVKPGEIVYIGAIQSNLFDAQRKAKEAGADVPHSDFDLPDGVNGLRWIVPVKGDVDPRLAGAKVTLAALHPSPHFANFFGLLIDRISPIPGVLAYDRDKAVDLATLTGGSTDALSAR